MDTPETPVHCLATLEETLHTGKEPDKVRLVVKEGLEVCHKRARPLVELWSLAYESMFP
jgi:hypothetical protein